MAPLPELIRPLLQVIARIGVDPEDSEDLRLHKALLVGGSLMFILAESCGDCSTSPSGNPLPGRFRLPMPAFPC